LSTITDPLSVPESQVSSIGEMISAVAGIYQPLFPKLDGSNYRVALLESSSSTHKVSWTGIVRDAYHLSGTNQWDNIMSMMKLTNAVELIKLFESVTGLMTTYSDSLFNPAGYFPSS